MADDGGAGGLGVVCVVKLDASRGAAAAIASWRRRTELNCQHSSPPELKLEYTYQNT